jgi:ubiquinone/menaquinone biosynthesis C-methylase UbiE
MLEQHYYTELACAFVRGRLPDAPALPPAELIEYGREQGLRVHKFKRTTELPRVRKVLGLLQGIYPSELLDIGSGRGVFLWPVLDTFPYLPVTALDRAPQRVLDLEAVQLGGIEHLTATTGDVTALDFPADAFDMVTILEVLEHLPNPILGAKEVLRVAKRFVAASVPSQPDDNPEHLHLFTADTLSELFHNAAEELQISITVKCEYVLNHMIALVRKG